MQEVHSEEESPLLPHKYVHRIHQSAILSYDVLLPCHRMFRIALGRARLHVSGRTLPTVSMLPSYGNILFFVEVCDNLHFMGDKRNATNVVIALLTNGLIIFVDPNSLPFL